MVSVAAPDAGPAAVLSGVAAFRMECGCALALERPFLRLMSQLDLFKGRGLEEAETCQFSGRAVLALTGGPSLGLEAFNTNSCAVISVSLIPVTPVLKLEETALLVQDG